MTVCSPRPTSYAAAVGRTFVLLCFFTTCLPALARAQGDKTAHWGVTASGTPSWTLAPTLKKALFEDNEEGHMDGSEFTIGFVRGSTRGGDWGVSYVRKPFDDGSGSTKTEQQCFGPNFSPPCGDEVETVATQGMYLSGVEIHWAPSFVTIKNHVQIGLNVGGGAASVKGNVVKTTDGFTPTFTPPNKITLTPTHEQETLLASEELTSIFPLLKLEAVANVIVVPALKIRFSGGLNFPSSTAFRIAVVYLIGAK
jgi:hypothetical protein